MRTGLRVVDAGDFDPVSNAEIRTKVTHWLNRRDALKTQPTPEGKDA